jgi:hypothetical protein
VTPSQQQRHPHSSSSDTLTAAATPSQQQQRHPHSSSSDTLTAAAATPSQQQQRHPHSSSSDTLTAAATPSQQQQRHPHSSSSDTLTAAAATPSQQQHSETHLSLMDRLPLLMSKSRGGSGSLLASHLAPAVLVMGNQTPFCRRGHHHTRRHTQHKPQSVVSIHISTHRKSSLRLPAAVLHARSFTTAPQVLAGKARP